MDFFSRVLSDWTPDSFFAPRAGEQIVQSAACMEAQQQKTGLITDSQKDS